MGAAHLGLHGSFSPPTQNVIGRDSTMVLPRCSLLGGPPLSWNAKVPALLGGPQVGASADLCWFWQSFLCFSVLGLVDAWGSVPEIPAIGTSKDVPGGLGFGARGLLFCFSLPLSHNNILEIPGEQESDRKKKKITISWRSLFLAGGFTDIPAYSLDDTPHQVYFMTFKNPILRFASLNL
mmetsp:Transcript_56556/g.100807  ORF Transcript_56556/g.100807 Transcript_56556/m.100807 type:complete len:180 (-) Transcript_56556:114-653(-)